MAQILYGAPVREKIKKGLISRVSNFFRKPVLVIVQIGNRFDSSVYIRKKKQFGEEIGAIVLVKNFAISISQVDLIKEIKKINEDKSVDGVIVQLPLPEHLDSEKIVRNIDQMKDADGLTTAYLENSLLVTPATARAVEVLLDFYKIEVTNKKIAVIGRSKLAGGPIATMLSKKGAKVTVCHRETSNTKEICRNADIIISAAGEANLVTRDFVGQGQVVIDVGINKVEGKLVGDVDFENVEPIVKAITPVPGGIGPLTVACLFENLLDLVSRK